MMQKKHNCNEPVVKIITYEFCKICHPPEVLGVKKQKLSNDVHNKNKHKINFPKMYGANFWF